MSLKAILIKIGNWQNGRDFWIYLAIISGFCVFFSHYFFQKYLFMLPCEQCVYVRFALCVIALGAIFAAINPKNIFLKILGFVFGIYGVILGISSALHLNAIHKALHGGDMFGIQGCSAEPKFILNLPLHEIFPAIFKPLGDCGYDMPVVPNGAKLDATQEVLVKLYENGWYLVPQMRFINLAECSFILFFVIAILFALTILFGILMRNRF